MSLPIYKYLDISTAHITLETNGYLRKAVRDEYDPLIVYKKYGGYFISVPDEEYLDDIEEFIPGDLAACLGFALKHGCNWLILDGDAEIIKELKTYEWR